jgi:hypothetical protein
MSADESKRTLEYAEIERLRSVLDCQHQIHGKGNFPTIEVQPRLLIQEVHSRLRDAKVGIIDVRLNGGAATHVISEGVLGFKDLDVIFTIDVPPIPHHSNRNQNRQRKFSSRNSTNHNAENGSRNDPNNSKTSTTSSYSSSSTASPALTPSKVPSSSTAAGSSPPCKTTFDPANPRIGESSLTCRSAPTTKKGNKSGNGGNGQSTRNNTSKKSYRNFSKIDYRQAIDGDERWRIIRDTVMSVLLSQLPSDVRKDRLTTEMISSAYVNKLVKINNEHDRWSLVSLSNDKGRNLELKFVESMRRQFEFSVDSFQIILDSYIKFSSLADIHITRNFYPSVAAQSVYGSFEEARFVYLFIQVRPPKKTSKSKKKTKFHGL